MFSQKSNNKNHKKYINAIAFMLFVLLTTSSVMTVFAGSNDSKIESSIDSSSDVNSSDILSNNKTKNEDGNYTDKNGNVFINSDKNNSDSNNSDSDDKSDDSKPVITNYKTVTAFAGFEDGYQTINLPYENYFSEKEQKKAKEDPEYIADAIYAEGMLPSFLSGYVEGSDDIEKSIPVKWSLVDGSESEGKKIYKAKIDNSLSINNTGYKMTDNDSVIMPKVEINIIPKESFFSKLKKRTFNFLNIASYNDNGDKEGWSSNNGEDLSYVYSNGIKAESGISYINGEWYSFDEDGLTNEESTFSNYRGEDNNNITNDREINKVLNKGKKVKSRTMTASLKDDLKNSLSKFNPFSISVASIGSASTPCTDWTQLSNAISSKSSGYIYAKGNITMDSSVENSNGNTSAQCTDIDNANGALWICSLKKENLNLKSEGKTIVSKQGILGFWGNDNRTFTVTNDCIDANNSCGVFCAKSGGVIVSNVKFTGSTNAFWDVHQEKGELHVYQCDFSNDKCIGCIPSEDSRHIKVWQSKFNGHKSAGSVAIHVNMHWGKSNNIDVRNNNITNYQDAIQIDGSQCDAAGQSVSPNAFSVYATDNTINNCAMGIKAYYPKDKVAVETHINNNKVYGANESVELTNNKNTTVDGLISDKYGTNSYNNYGIIVKNSPKVNIINSTIKNGMADGVSVRDNSTVNFNSGTKATEITGYDRSRGDEAFALTSKGGCIVNINSINIHDNKSSQGTVRIYQYGTVNMYNGTIQNNNGAVFGGAVANDGTFNLVNGTIKNNTCDHNDTKCGIWQSGTMIMSGNAVVDASNDVMIASGDHPIRVDSALSNSNVARVKPYGYYSDNIYKAMARANYSGANADTILSKFTLVPQDPYCLESGVKINNIHNSTKTSDCVIYAYFNVIYHSNYTNGPDNKVQGPIGYDSKWIAKPYSIFSRTGYTLTEWNTETNGSGISVGQNSGQGAIHNDTHLYAQWTPNKYTNTLKYNANGGTGAPADQTASVTYPNTQSTFTISSTQPTRNGYIFAGWYTDPNSGSKVESTYTFGNNSHAGNQSATLYAHWISNNLTVTYKSNYTGGPSDVTQYISYNSGWTTKNGSTFTRSGYKLSSWNTNANGSGTKYSLNTAQNARTSNLILYAQWTPLYYLDLNGILDGKSSGNLGSFGTADVYINGTLVSNDCTDFYNAYPTGTKYEIKDIKSTTGHYYAGCDQSLSGTIGTSNVGISLKLNTMKVTVNFYRNQNSSDTTKDSRTYTWGVSNQKFVDFGWTKTGYSALGYNEIRSAISKQYELTNGISNDWIISKFNANSSHSVNLYEIWKAKQYNFTITGDSGIESVTGSGTYDYGTVVKSTIKVKTGYHIVNTSGTTADGSGTNTWTNLSGKEGTQTENWTINGNRTIKVNSAPNTYTVTYDANGGTGAPAAQNFVFNSGAKLSTTKPTWTGHTFLKWTTNRDGSGTTFNPGDAIPNGWGSFTIYAQWSVNKYYIDLNAILDGVYSGGLGSFGTADVYINGTLVANDTADYYTAWPYGTKYEIKDIKPSTGHYYAGCDQSLSGTLGAGDLGINLKLNTKKITVNFYRNHSNTDTTVQSKTYTWGVDGQKFVDFGWTKTGYSALGYNEIRSAISKQYELTNGISNDWINSKYDANNSHSVNLYEIWSINKYRIDVTGDSGVESISGNGSYNYGTSVTLTYKIKNGYHITSVTGDKADGTQGTWTDLAGKVGTQYDTWTVLSFNRKGFVHTAPNTYSDNIGLLAGGFKNGEGNHSSKNWYYYSNKYFNKNYGDTINITTSDCPELPKGFYLNSSQGFGSGSFANSWTGYTFPKSFTQPAKDVYFEFYALPNTYSITYNMNGGTNNSSNPSSYNILYGVTFNNPTRKGYTFTGWTDENGNKVTGINPGANATFSSASDMKTKLNSRTIGNKTITANWRANSYTVTIHPNSGSINVGDKNITKTSDGCAKFTVTYGSSSFYALGVSGSKTGYTTTGIFDKTSGGIKVWNNGGYCLKDGKYWNSSNQWCYAGNVDLYFQWTPNHYKLTLNPNNGKFNSDNSTAAKTLSPDLIYDNGNWNNISSHSVSRTGYTFQGWYTAPSGGTKVYNANGSCTNEGTYFVNNVYHYTNNLIVYAHWTPNTYTVTYDSNKPKNAPTNVTGSTASNKATYDSNFLTTKNGFSLTGYTFVGWNEKPDGSGTAWTLTTNGVYEYENGKHPWKWNYTKDITLYAQWRINKYNVTINPNGGIYNGTTKPTTVQVTYNDLFKIIGMPTRDGYHFASWTNNLPKLDSQGNLLAQGLTRNYAIGNGTMSITNNNKYTNYKISGINVPSSTNQWDHISFGPYSVKSGQTVVISGEYRINSNPVGLNLYHGDHANDYNNSKKHISGTTNGWVKFSISRTFTADTNTGYFEIYTGNLSGITNGTIDFDLRRIKIQTTASNGTLTDIHKDQFVMPAYDITLTANWDPNVLTTNFHNDGAQTFKDGDNTVLNISGKDIFKTDKRNYDDVYDATYGLLNVDRFSKTGYHSGAIWYAGSKGSNIQISDSLGLPKVQDIANAAGKLAEFKKDDVTIDLYPKLDPNNYTVTYNKNKPSNATHEVMGTTANSSHVYDTAKNLTKNGYSLVGWRFNGWNDKPDGTGKSYKDQASVKNLTTTNNGNVILYAQWVANTYTVTYNKNKPSDATHEVMGTTANSSHVYDTAKNLTKNGYSLVGWKFNGWNDKPDGTGKPYKDQESVKNLTTSHGGTVILYAQWIKNNYTVTYNKNKPTIASHDVQGTTASNIATYDSNFVTTKNGYSLVGWRFNGWNEKPDGSGTAWTLTSNGVYEYENGKHPWKWTYDKNVTLYAQWIPNTYTVTYDSNKPVKASGSITGSTANSSHTYDVSKALNKNGYKLTGWTFTGWNDKKDGSGNSYSDGQIVKNLTDTHNGTVTLYAQWRQNTYTIIYDKNKPGKASGTVTGNTVNSVHTYEEWKTLTPNSYWLDGWTFTGWNDKADGTGKPYKDKQSVLNLVTSDKGSITLYAQWTQNKLTLNFHNDKAEYYKTGNDSSTNMNIKGKDLFMTNNYYYDNNYDSQWGLPNVERFTKTGYHSGENWYVDKLGSSLKISDSLGLPYVQDLAKAANKLDAFKKGNITIDIYPQLDPNHYYIKFDKNKPTKASSEVTGSMYNVEHIYDSAKTLPANGYKLTGWTFTGWNTKADGSGKSYSDKSSVINLTTENQGTTILYAQWRQNTYTINYNGNKPAKASHDVAGSTASSSHIYEEWKTLTPNGFSLTGWTFTGWNDKPDGTGKPYKDKQSIRNLVTSDKGSITLYAQWRQNTYTVIYDKNKPGKASHDVQGTMPNSSHIYDDYKKLTKNNYTLTGWTFTGWNTKPDGSGTKYSDGQSIRNFTEKDKGTFTLYAQWKQNRYTITFHKNHRDVTGTMNVQWFTYDEQQKLSKNQFVLKGYRFDHWNTKSNNSGISYNDQAIILNLTPVNGGNIDFYAQWKLNITISMTVEDEIYHVNDIVTPSDIRESIKPKIVDKATGEDITYTFNPDVTRDPLTNIVTKEIINDEGTKQDVTKNLITNKEDHYKVTYEFTITDTGITEKSTQTQKLTVIKDIEDIEQNKPKDPDPTTPTPSITPDPGTTNPMIPDGIDPSDGSQYNITNDIRYISKKYLPSLNKNSKWRTNSDLFNELKTSVSKEATDDNAIYIIEFNKDECDEMKQWLVDGKVWNEDLNKQFLNEFGSKIIKKQP